MRPSPDDLHAQLKMILTKAEAAEFIQDESERQCIEHLGYTPHTWYTGGSDHNDDRLTAEVDEDRDIIVRDGNATETYTGRLTKDAIADYVSDWLENLWNQGE